MLRSIVMGLILLLSFKSQAERLQSVTIPIYTYHAKPPFIVNQKLNTGLFYDVIRYINSKETKSKFALFYVPRKRLDDMLKNGLLDGPIIGVNPLWFNDKQEIKYHWTTPIYWDTDDFVSLKSSKFEYIDKSSLTGKSFAGVAGHYYVHLRDATVQGSLTRVDTIGGPQILSMVEKMRADFGVISRSTYQNLLKHHQIKDIFHISNLSHESFERRILVPLHLKKVAKQLADVTRRMPKDEEWLRYLNFYQ